MSAGVYVGAFEKEGITRYIFDFSRGNTREYIRRLLIIDIKFYLETGNHIFLAMKGQEVAGLAILLTNLNPPLSRTVIYNIRRMTAGFPLLTRVSLKRVFHFIKAGKLSQRLKGPYHTLQGLAVSPHYQGQGIGKLLLKEVQKLSENSHRITGIYLYTADRKNQVLYERFGYQTIEERRAGELVIYHMFRSI